MNNVRDVIIAHVISMGAQDRYIQMQKMQSDLRNSQLCVNHAAGW